MMIGGAGMTSTPLQAELNTFDSHKSEWLREHDNEYVVIRGAAVLGFYRDFPAAYFAGAEAFGSETDFLVKKIAQNEPVFVIY